MAAILPGSPPGYNRDNLTGTVRSVCDYLRSTHDNMDFQLGQLVKRLDALEKGQAGLESRVGTAEKTITALTEGSGS